MLGKSWALVALGALALATSVHGAKIANNTMSVGDGTTVTTNSTTTVYLGTEYNPAKCLLQFASVKCKNTKECGELNGYPLQCDKLGMQDGAMKSQCRCRSNETELCQNATVPAKTGVPQFGDCSSNKPCADTYGHVPSKLDLRICAEKLHCVKEINTTATVPAEICHTCRSCIAQNNNANSTLMDKRRFDCTTICPPEILDSIAKRNKQGLGIADEVNSTSASGSSESASGSGSVEGSVSGSKAASKKKSSAVEVSLSLAAVVSSIVLAIATN